MAHSTSSYIAEKYQSLGRGSTVLKLSVTFDQTKFMNTNRKFAESLSDKLNKPLLQDYYVENAAAKGLCSAAVMQWFDTGSVPSPTEYMVTKLSKVQGSFEVDNERDYLTWCSNLSAQFKNLENKKVKDSKGLQLNTTQTLINYLLDFTGNVNTNYKLFLILVFKDGNAHAVGLNLKTKQFFDPNHGVWDIQTGDNPAENITYSIFGLEQIRGLYGNVATVGAITYL